MRDRSDRDRSEDEKAGQGGAFLGGTGGTGGHPIWLTLAESTASHDAGNSLMPVFSDREILMSSQV